jgi:hypothetical protein
MDPDEAALTPPQAPVGTIQLPPPSQLVRTACHCVGDNVERGSFDICKKRNDVD